MEGISEVREVVEKYEIGREIDERDLTPQERQLRDKASLMFEGAKDPIGPIEQQMIDDAMLMSPDSPVTQEIEEMKKALKS